MTEAVSGAVLLSAMRNEGPDVLEWVAFHRLIGFGKIVVYTNACSDGSDDLFDALAALGWVEHHRHQPPATLAPQDAVAALALENPTVRGAEWLLWIDADEFLNPVAGHLSGLIAAIGAADGVALNWRNFGDCGHDTAPDDLVLAAFTQAAPMQHRQSRTVKTLHRMDDRVQSLFIHRPIWRQGAAVRLLAGSGQVLDPQFVFGQKKNARPAEMLERGDQSYALGQINHYVIKALERVAAISILDSQEFGFVIPSDYGRCWGSLMGKPLPMELRQRVVDFVEEGHTHRSAAAQFRVSVKFVNDMVRLKRATGSLAAKPQGNGGGHGKLAGVVDWIARRITEKRDLTLDELVVELRCGPGVEVHRVSVWRRLRSLDLTHKKRPARRRAEAA